MFEKSWKSDWAPLDIDFPFTILRFFLPQNHLVLLSDQCLKKMLLKRANTGRLFRKNIGSNICLLYLKTISGF